MSYFKTRPYKSRAFLAHCHETDGACCLCRTKPWVMLHHFGDDGGQSLKPSDNEVARVCADCHRNNDYKRKSLIRNGYYEILDKMQNDALKLNRVYMEKLEGK